jgi:NitT/TauT family transport system substrate-binding protein
MATRCLTFLLTAALASAIGLGACTQTGDGGEVREVRIPVGAGGVGFLPMLMMRQHNLIEGHAKAAGIADLQVRWIDVGGPAIMNDALLSGSVDFIAAGPPAFITLWDRTRGSVKVMGVAAIVSLPMYLNTTAAHLKALDDLKEGDKVAMTAIKVSIPALVMQMYAKEKYGPSEVTRFDKYTVSMTHPDGLVALLSGAVNAHFTSPPFHQRERRDPRIRTVMSSSDVMGGSTTFAMLSTTTEFRARNPKVYGAVLKALGEAHAQILADRPAAARILLGSGGEAGFSEEELVDVLKDPEIRFTTTPENVMKYAEFMSGAGSITTRPSSWKDMFFPEIHELPGS